MSQPEPRISRDSKRSKEMKRLAYDAFTANICRFVCYLITSDSFLAAGIMFAFIVYFGVIILGVTPTDSLIPDSMAYPLTFLRSLLLIQVSTMLYLHWSRR